MSVINATVIPMMNSIVLSIVMPLLCRESLLARRLLPFLLTARAGARGRENHFQFAHNYADELPVEVNGAVGLRLRFAHFAASCSMLRAIKSAFSCVLIHCSFDAPPL